MSNTRRNRMAANLCLSCGGSRDSKAQNCRACTAKNIAQQKAAGTNTTRSRRELAGVCIECGGARDSEAKRCRECTRIMVEKTKARGGLSTRDRRKMAGVCVDCGGELGSSPSRCDVCRVKQVDYRIARQEAASRVDNTICVNCNRPRDQATKLCSVCTANTATASKQWRQERKEVGTQCMYCPAPRWHKSTSCRLHFVEKVLNNFHISAHFSEQMARRLEEADFKCFYTDTVLIPGENASLDHVKPRSKFPHLVDCLDNLVWCDRTINNMKTALEVPDMLTACRKMLEKADRIMAKHIQVSSLPQPLTIPPTSVS